MPTDKDHKVETVSELPTIDGHLPSYQKLLDTAIDLSFPASDPPAISACNRCADEPLPAQKEETDLTSKGQATGQKASTEKKMLSPGNEVDWVLNAERAEDA